MGGFNGFTNLARGVAGGGAGVAAGIGSYGDYLMKKRALEAQAAQAQAKLGQDAAIANSKAAAEAAGKRMDVEERGAEKGLRLAPIVESDAQRNKRIASLGRSAADVVGAGGDLEGEPRQAFEMTSSLGGVLRNQGSDVNQRAKVGEQWQRDPSLEGPAKPTPWKKGALYDIEDEARQNTGNLLGTTKLMDAIMSGALHGDDLKQALDKYDAQQKNFAKEMTRQTRLLVDTHEKNGELTPEQANALRSHFTGAWTTGTQDQGAPASPEQPAPAGAAPLAPPKSDDEEAAARGTASQERAMADQLEQKLAAATPDGPMEQIARRIQTGGPDEASFVGAGEAESPAENEGEGEEEAPAQSPMPPSTTDLISRAMRGIGPSATTATPPPSLMPNLTGQIGRAQQRGTSLGLNESPTPIVQRQGAPMDRNFDPNFGNPNPQIGGGTAPPASPSPMLPTPPALSQFQDVINMINKMNTQPSVSRPFMPPIGAQRPPAPFSNVNRPNPTAPFAMPPQGTPPPSPPPAMSNPLGALQRFGGALGLGGLGTPGAGAMPGGGRGAPIAPPSSMPSMYGAPSPQQFRTTVAQPPAAPHFPTRDELEPVVTDTGAGALVPQAAQAYQAALADPTLSPDDRAAIGRIVSSTRTPDEQNGLHQRYLDFVGANPGATVDQIAAATGIRMPAGHAPPSAGAAPPRSGHLAGSGLDLPTTLSDAAKAALTRAGWRQPVAGDPEHWEYRAQW